MAKKKVISKGTAAAGAAGLGKVTASTSAESTAKVVSAEKVLSSKTVEPVNVRERLKELENKHIAFVESIHKINVETDFGFRKSLNDYELELRAASLAGDDGVKFKEVEEGHVKGRHELHKSSLDSKQELADAYLKDMKQAWSDLQQSDVDFSKLGELGFFFSNLTCEAAQLKDHF